MQIIKMNDEQLHSLYAFAKPIWEEVYEGVIPKGQIELLVNKYFTYEHLLKFIDEGMQYYYLIEDYMMIGFTAYKVNDDDTYLDKLYLIPEYRRKGISTLVFNHLLETYKKPITLNVNHNNVKAYNAYLKNGFKVKEKITIPLPDGYVNIDYIMQLDVK